MSYPEHWQLVSDIDDCLLKECPFAEYCDFINSGGSGASIFECYCTGVADHSRPIEDVIQEAEKSLQSRVRECEDSRKAIEELELKKQAIQAKHKATLKKNAEVNRQRRMERKKAQAERAMKNMAEAFKILSSFR